MLLSDILKPEIVAELDVRGYVVKLKKFTLEHQVRYELKGISITELIELLSIKPAMYATELIFDLMTDDGREFFATLDNLRACSDVATLATMAEAISTVLEASMPQEKNEQSAAVIKKTSTPRKK